MRPFLYKTDESPPARAVMMIGELLGISFEYKTVNPVAREQDSPELVKKNPMRTIPILEDEDFYLADSHAIIIYLIEKYGQTQYSTLYPEDLKKRTKVMERLFFDCGVLFPSLRAVMAPTFKGRLTEISRGMGANINRCYQTLEAYLSEAKYVADEQMTVADVSIFSTASSLDGIYPVDGIRFPKLKRWLQLMEQSDVGKINRPGCDMLVTTLTLLMRNNKANAKL